MSTYNEIIKYFEGNNWSKGYFPEAVAFEAEDDYDLKRGEIGINTYDRGGGMHTTVSIEDALKLLKWCVKKKVETYIVRDNYDYLDKF